MLRGNANARAHIRCVIPQANHQGCEFDRLWPRSENKQDGIHRADDRGMKPNFQNTAIEKRACNNKVGQRSGNRFPLNQLLVEPFVLRNDGVGGEPLLSCLTGSTRHLRVKDRICQ